MATSSENHPLNSFLLFILIIFYKCTIYKWPLIYFWPNLKFWTNSYSAHFVGKPLSLYPILFFPDLCCISGVVTYLSYHSCSLLLIRSIENFHLKRLLCASEVANTCKQHREKSWCFPMKGIPVHQVTANYGQTTQVYTHTFLLNYLNQKQSKGIKIFFGFAYLKMNTFLKLFISDEKKRIKLNLHCKQKPA